MAFERKLSKSIIGKLQDEQLYNDYLLPDIRKGDVFPAIRKEKITFYHAGGNLFSYGKNGFETNIKFASVSKLIKKGKEETYINEKDLGKIRTIKKFTDEYKGIKENCSRYSGIEAIGVSKVCEKDSYVKTDNDIVVLDVETSLESLDEDRSQDRIDLLLLNKRKKQLRFYEAKDFSNGEIRSRMGKKPKVVEQIIRYKTQVKVKGIKIIEAYNKYISIVNGIFSIDLEEIIDIDPDVYLLIFGFDRDQRSGQFKKYIKNDNSLKGIKGYSIGDMNNLKIENLWKGSKKLCT